MRDLRISQPEITRLSKPVKGLFQFRLIDPIGPAARPPHLRLLKIPRGPPAPFVHLCFRLGGGLVAVIPAEPSASTLRDPGMGEANGSSEMLWHEHMFASASRGAPPFRRGPEPRSCAY